MARNKKTENNKPEKGKDHIYIRTKAGQEEKFFWNDFLYLKAEKDYTKIVTTKGSHLMPCGFKEQIKKLQHPTLFQCHRSYAINTNCVDLLKRDCVIIKGNEIPVSKKYQEELSRKLHFMGGGGKIIDYQYVI